MMILENTISLIVCKIIAELIWDHVISTTHYQKNSKPLKNSTIIKLIEVKMDSLIKFQNLIVETQILKTMSLAKVKWSHYKSKLNNLKTKLYNLSIRYKF